MFLCLAGGGADCRVRDGAASVVEAAAVAARAVTSWGWGTSWQHGAVAAETASGAWLLASPPALSWTRDCCCWGSSVASVAR